MKRFNFKLQRLLDYRSFLEKEEQDKFSKVLGEYVAIQNVIDSAVQKSRIFLIESHSIIERGDFNLMFLRDKARKGLKTKIFEYNKKLKEKEIPLNKARQELVEAMRGKKVIEILKDKSKKAYQKEIDKEEQSELDEFGILSYNKENNFITKNNLITEKNAAER
ncbi:MAG: flagellar export protein FliJ [Spirochaetota bacterium]|nr:flagellar export protein FliJ [Spirochaetota bacterium]